jgi:hypothetical protein
LKEPNVDRSALAFLFRLVLVSLQYIAYALIMIRTPTPDDSNWKDYWRERGRDKNQSLARQDKRNARKRFHKKSRREGKNYDLTETD